MTQNLIPLLETFRLTIVVGERHHLAPEGFFIFNAPRPLYGSRFEDVNKYHKYGKWAYTWNGYPAYDGVFFAAVDPNDPDANTWITKNHELDATMISYVDLDTHKENVIAWALDYLIGINQRYDSSYTLASFSLTSWDQTYRRHCTNRIVGEWLS